MSAQLHSAAERPDLWERAYEQIVGVWPAYNEKGDVLGRHWSRLDQDFADYQLVLYDEEADVALAHGHSIPCRWDGTVDGLGDGIDQMMEGAVHLFDEGGGVSPYTLEVRVSNREAITMYERFGFRSAGLRHGYYHDNGEDAVIMWYEHEAGRASALA